MSPSTTCRGETATEEASLAGFVSDSNVLWNSNGMPPVKIGSRRFDRLEDYASATGRDRRSLQADPRFADPARGDFHLRPGSPAIDNADASPALWPAIDFEATPRFDDPDTPNQGLGRVTFADRGPCEYIGAARATLTAPAEAAGAEGQSISIPVEATPAEGHPIVSLAADLSDLPPGSGAVFAVSADGLHGTLSWTPGREDGREEPYPGRGRPDQAPRIRAPRTLRLAPGSPLTLDVAATDPDGDPIDALAADLSQLPDAGFSVAPGNASGRLSWIPHAVGTFAVTFTARNARVTQATMKVEVRNDDGDAGGVLLSGAWPNPASREVALTLELPRAGDVAWGIYDPQGREIWIERRAGRAGRTTLRWPRVDHAGRTVAGGAYFARVRFGGVTEHRRFLLLP